MSYKKILQVKTLTPNQNGSEFMQSIANHSNQSYVITVSMNTTLNKEISIVTLNTLVKQGAFSQQTDSK